MLLHLYKVEVVEMRQTQGEIYGKDLREIAKLMNCFNPYTFEPEKKDVSSTCSSSESRSEEIESDRQNETRVTSLDWCTRGNYKNQKMEIDCLRHQEVNVLNGIFYNEQVKCAVICEEFKTLSLNKIVLKNVLTGLHETREDPVEYIFLNLSLKYTAYKQFICWVFKKLGKGNRRVIPSHALWKIIKLYPKANGNYGMYLEGKQD